MTHAMQPDDDKPLTAQQARQKLQKGLSDYLAGNDSGPIVFRLKRTKKASETYPLKLTQHQRETLLQFTQLSRNLKKKIEQAGEGKQIVPVTWNELHMLNDETGQAAVYARNADRKRLMGVMGKVIKFFEKEHAEVFALEAPNVRKRHTAKTGLLFQFKITLRGSKPLIWRRIQIIDCTLDKLHGHIQTAMGWTNSHLHQFEIDGQRYTDPMLMEETFEEMNCQDSTATMLSDIMPKKGKRFSFTYEYDFGDGWEHEILFEGCPKPEPSKKYPLCLEGERTCPPEDVGGIGGFYEYLQALADPKHEQHDQFMEWCGPFDPDEFDAGMATKAMKKGLPDWRRIGQK